MNYGLPSEQSGLRACDLSWPEGFLNHVHSREARAMEGPRRSRFAATRGAPRSRPPYGRPTPLIGRYDMIAIVLGAALALGANATAEEPSADPPAAPEAPAPVEV